MHAAKEMAAVAKNVLCSFKIPNESVEKVISEISACLFSAILILLTDHWVNN